MNKQIQNKLALSEQVSYLMTELLYEQNSKKYTAEELFRMAKESGQSYDPFSGKVVDISKMQPPKIKEKNVFSFDDEEGGEEPVALGAGTPIARNVKTVKNQLKQSGRTLIDDLTEADIEKLINKGGNCVNIYGAAGVIFGKGGDEIFTSTLKATKAIGKVTQIDKALGLREKKPAASISKRPAGKEFFDRLKRIGVETIKFKLWVARKTAFAGLLASAAAGVVAANVFYNTKNEYNKMEEENKTLARLAKLLAPYTGRSYEEEATFVDKAMGTMVASQRAYNRGNLLAFPSQQDADCFVYGLFGGFAASRLFKVGFGATKAGANLAVDASKSAYKAFTKDRAAAKLIREIAEEDKGWKILGEKIEEVKKLEGLDDLMIDFSIIDETGDVVYYLRNVPEKMTEKQARVLSELQDEMDVYNEGLQKTMQKGLQREYKVIMDSPDYQRMKKLLSQVDKKGKLPDNFVNKTRMLDRLELSRETVLEAERLLGDLKKSSTDLSKLDPPEGWEEVQQKIWRNLTSGNQPMSKIIDMDDPFQGALVKKLSDEYKLIKVLQTENYNTGLKTINDSIRNSGIKNTKEFDKQMKETRKRILYIRSELSKLPRKGAARILKSTARAAVIYGVGGLGLAAIPYVALEFADDLGEINFEEIKKRLQTETNNLYKDPNGPIPKSKAEVINNVLKRTANKLDGQEKKLILAIINNDEAKSSISKSFFKEEIEKIRGDNVETHKRVANAIFYSIETLAQQNNVKYTEPLSSTESSQLNKDQVIVIGDSNAVGLPVDNERKIAKTNAQTGAVYALVQNQIDEKIKKFEPKAAIIHMGYNGPKSALKGIKDTISLLKDKRISDIRIINVKVSGNTYVDPTAEKAYINSINNLKKQISELEGVSIIDNNSDNNVKGDKFHFTRDGYVELLDSALGGGVESSSSRGAEKASGDVPVPTKQGLFDESSWSNFRKTVRSVESKDNYQARRSGSQMLGAYQMSDYARNEAAKALGIDSPSYDDFLNDPQLQEKMYSKWIDLLLEKDLNKSWFRSLSKQEKTKLTAVAHHVGLGPKGRVFFDSYRRGFLNPNVKDKYSDGRGFPALNFYYKIGNEMFGENNKLLPTDKRKRPMIRIAPGADKNIANTTDIKLEEVKQMSKLDIRELVKEVLNENSGQGYAKYPYGSSVRDEEQPKKDYIEDWKALSLELVRDESRNTAIQIAKLLVLDLELFEDVMDLAGQNQSVGEEILRKLKETREKA